MTNQMEVLEQMWVHADEYIDASEECLILGITFGGRARHTGLDVELTPFHVFDLRDGRVLRWRVFESRARALEPAGLRE